MRKFSSRTFSGSDWGSDQKFSDRQEIFEDLRKSHSSPNPVPTKANGSANGDGTTTNENGDGTAASANGDGTAASANGDGTTTKANGDGVTTTADGDANSTNANGDGTPTKAKRDGTVRRAKGDGTTTKANRGGITARAKGDGTTTNANRGGITARAKGDGTTTRVNGNASPGDGTTANDPPTPSPLLMLKPIKAKLRVLVTGGAGFIGSHLVDRLMEAGTNEVVVVDNFFSGSKGNLKRWIGHPNFELILHDITEPLLLEVNQIYHLACPSSPIFYKHNPIKTIKTNVIGTLNMLGVAKRVGARILLTSTSEVYGDPLKHPQTEEYWGNVNPIGVRSCYDEGKRVAETLMFDYHRQHGIDIRIARIFNTYGPRMKIDDGRVVSNFIAQALRNEKLTVQAPGTQTRSFCYVSDMVDGLIRLMSGKNTGPMNLGNPEEFTIMELAETVQKLIGPSTVYKLVENTPDDPQQRKPDITKATKLLGWKPSVTLQEGLPLMITDFRARLDSEEKYQ